METRLTETESRFAARHYNRIRRYLRGGLRKRGLRHADALSEAAIWFVRFLADPKLRESLPELPTRAKASAYYAVMRVCENRVVGGADRTHGHIDAIAPEDAAKREDYRRSVIWHGETGLLSAATRRLESIPV